MVIATNMIATDLDIRIPLASLLRQPTFIPPIAPEVAFKVHVGSLSSICGLCISTNLHLGA
jgi:hypothetical protein